jgi:hypothetical protein
MTETTIVSPQSYLTTDGQESLNVRVDGIKGKITNAFNAKLDIMFDLEEIRWSATWLDDEIWKEWDAEYQAKGKNRAPRAWSNWVSLRGIQGDDMKLEDAKSYQLWLATAVLHRLIDAHNDSCDIVSEENLLPLPTSVWQVDAMTALFKRADAVPTSLYEHEDSSGRGVLPPYLPIEEQTHLIEYWETAWQQSPRQFKTVNDIAIPVAPSRETVRKTLESLDLKQPVVPRERTVDALMPSPETDKKRDEVWEGIKARQGAGIKYNAEQQQRSTQQAKEIEEQQEQRSRLFRYNELLVTLKRDINNLDTFVSEVDHTLGTQYFDELRQMKVGMITVADDMERLQAVYELLKTVCQRVASHNPPSGIHMTTIEV